MNEHSVNEVITNAPSIRDNYIKVGSIVFATDQGLGILAKSLYQNQVITHPYVFAHASRLNHFEWYPNCPVLRERRPNWGVLREWVNTVDVMLFLETPFDWGLIPYCRDHDIPTVMMTMYECTPKQLPAIPDKFLCPSLLDLQYFPPIRSEYIPVPVEVPWRQRVKAHTFVHNAGHGGLKDRNGTIEVIKAWEYVKSPAKLVIRSQKPLISSTDSRVEIRIGTFPFETLYEEGDVFIFPEKFNGLSLPLQEARAAGMLVMAADRFPMNEWLPKEPLIPLSSTRMSSISPRCFDYEEAIIEPRDIAAKVDQWYGRDIANYSSGGRDYAMSMSWDIWYKEYKRVLMDLVKGNKCE